MKRLLLVAIATLSAVSAAQGPEKEAVPPPETVAGPSGDNAQPAAESVDGGGDHAGARGEVPMARDVPYPGTITLKVDSTDLQRRLFSVHESIPVRAGPLTLLYPEWIPGNHAPRGPIDGFAGLLIRAGGRALEWQRDAVNVYAFHLIVPANIERLDVEFQFASPFFHDQGRVVMTPDIVGLQWNTVVVYPAGYYVRRIIVQPELTLPAGWEFAAALDIEQRQGNVISFKATTLERLVDSPLFAGRYFRALDLDPGAAIAVRLSVVADGLENLIIRPAQLAAHRRLVHETYALLGPPHYDRYEFLLALSDHFAEIGLEHLRSSENRRSPGYFIDWDKTGAGRDLLPHEFSHVWNGKFRRPVGLATPDYNTPMHDSLLWVYEGLTNYLGYVLAARSGLWSEDYARQAWASVAANLDRDRAGRAWRDLEDTTGQPIITPRRPLSWLSWQRTEDYYTEGQLIWLDVDTRIRELTGERRSLDDFLRSFFAANTQSAGAVPELVTYTFADIVQALKALAPFDWQTYFATRLHSHGPGAPLDGLTRGGWKLVFTEIPSDYTRSLEEQRKVVDFTYSLGFDVGIQTAQLAEVRWGGPAYEAGLALGTTLIAVNGREYTPERLRVAIAEAKLNKQPIELLVKNLDRYRTVRLAYFDGLMYPQLERIEKARDRLSVIMKPRT